MHRRLFVHLTTDNVREESLAGDLVVVTDVLRATTSIVHALAAGAQSVQPYRQIDEVLAEAERVGRSSVLLAGERGGQPIPGFDLGNSPREFDPATCRDRTILFTTTNGTSAILHARQARRVLIGAFVNLQAVAQACQRDSGQVHLLCAGTEGEVSWEDSLFAGAVVNALIADAPFELNDAARMSADCYQQHRADLATAFSIGRGGRNLTAIGLADDLPFAADVNRFAIVPEATFDPTLIRVAAD